MAALRESALFNSSSVTRDSGTDGRFRDQVSTGDADAQPDDVYTRTLKEKCIWKKRRVSEIVMQVLLHF